MAITILGGIGRNADGTLQTSPADAVDATTTVDRATSHQIGAGNLLQWQTAARMGGQLGLRQSALGSGSPVTNLFYDFTNTDPSFWMRKHWRLVSSSSNTGVATIARGYATTAHTGNNWSLVMDLPTRKLSYTESVAGGLNLQSAAGLPIGGDGLVFTVTPHGTTGAVTVRGFLRFSTDPLFELTGTSPAPFVTTSLRFGVGNTGTNLVADLNDETQWGYGFDSSNPVPRPDVVTISSDPASTWAAPASTDTAVLTVGGGGTGPNRQYAVEKDGQAWLPAQNPPTFSVPIATALTATLVGVVTSPT